MYKRQGAQGCIWGRCKSSLTSLPSSRTDLAQGPRQPCPFLGEFRVKDLLDKLEGDHSVLEMWVLYQMLGGPL